MNYQTVICELTSLPLANCSLLDEATAGAEAVTMMYNIRTREQIRDGVNKIFIDRNIFEQTKAVIHTRMIPQGIDIVTGDWDNFIPDNTFFGAIVQYPDSKGEINDYTKFAAVLKENNIKLAVAADIMSLAILTPPGEWGADICFGSTQRLGMPMYYGGPSAAYFATKEENKRFIPGRLVGYSIDRNGKKALRMALQTREQHIKREKATSNICTAQALMATMAGFYAVYMGPKGIKEISETIHINAIRLAETLLKMGLKVTSKDYFDTIRIENIDIDKTRRHALSYGINLFYGKDFVSVSINETTTEKDLNHLVEIFADISGNHKIKLVKTCTEVVPHDQIRHSSFMQQDIFNKYHTETDMMRYIKRLERKDISLAHSMIPLGSCTMKLNAASEMLALSNIKFQAIHPLAPISQAEGYKELIDDLTHYLAIITGMSGVSLQPNSGAAGEYAGLRVIRTYHEVKGEHKRNIVLIPASAHGTNPASAAQCGYSIVVVSCDEKGNVDMQDLIEKANLHKENLAALMITYPSTHGIFEKDIKECCDIIHECGGQVYMDGANMNAQVGLTSPGHIGADICHLNLHKTFAMPHGGGGPGVGPICAKEHLVEYLPHHPFIDGSDLDTVSAAPYGSAGLLPVTYGYIRMMGAKGLTESTKTAILSANYLSSILAPYYGIVFTGTTGRVGHELILDCRRIKESSGIDETDIAKRLMDYGYHAPTLSFPVHGTLMIEPTESESLTELKQFCDAMINIYNEIKEVENGEQDKSDNVLKNAPHPQYEICADSWTHKYGREKASFPTEYVKDNKFWINVARVDNALGDRNLCACIG